MKYKQYAPPFALRHYVRYFWECSSSGAGVSKLLIQSFADIYPRLIFQDLENYEQLVNKTSGRLPECYISGIDTKDTEALMGGAFSHFGISFYPHALNAVFGINASELVNKMPDIKDIVKDELGIRLRRANNIAEKIDVMSRYLYQKIKGQSSNTLINDIICSNAVSASTPLRAIHKKYTISERHLERKFRVSVGISPGKYQRILRFEKSLAMLAEAEYKDLTAIAYDLNYTDQSHFIKDFKAFSGMTPYKFVQKQMLGSENSSFIYMPPS